jgi:hypothetical protein
MPVRVQLDDGRWQPVLDATDISPTWNKTGPDQLTFTVARSPQQLHRDLFAFTPLEMHRGEKVLWGGYLIDAPGSTEEEDQINATALGWQYHLDDDPLPRATALHRRLSEWTDYAGHVEADLTQVKLGGTVSTNDGALLLAWPKSNGEAPIGEWGTLLDLGEDNRAKRVEVVFDAIGDGNGFLTLTGADNARRTKGVEYTDGSWGAGDVTNLRVGLTFTSPKRFIHLRYKRTAVFTFAGDIYIKIKDVLVAREPGYVNDAQSQLTATTVIRDARDRGAPKLDRSDHLIQDTTYKLPEVAPEPDSTPRTLLDLANSFHRWLLRVNEDRTVTFRAQPDRPVLEVDTGRHGVTFQDASQLDGREIYNRVVVRGRTAAGEPVRVERFPLDGWSRHGIPQPANPSATTDLAGWAATFGTLVRDTAVFDSAPASFKAEGDGGSFEPWATSDIVTHPLRAGELYRLTIRVRTPVNNFPWVQVIDPAQTKGYGGTKFSHSDAAWVTRTIMWRQPEDATGYRVRVIIDPLSGTGIGHFDDPYLERCYATPMCRRGFTRTKILDVSTSINVDEAGLLGDAWIAYYQRTPLKGTLTLAGPQAIKTFPAGQWLEPADAGTLTGQLVLLSDLTDPATAAKGRVGIIAGATYDEDENVAHVTIDNARDSLEALLARMAVNQRR